MVPLAPGGEDPIWEKTGRAAEYDNEETAQARKQLYTAMNCVGCPPTAAVAWGRH